MPDHNYANARLHWQLASQWEMTQELSHCDAVIDRTCLDSSRPEYRLANLSFIGGSGVTSLHELDANDLESLASLLREMADILRRDEITCEEDGSHVQHP